METIKLSIIPNPPLSESQDFMRRWIILNQPSFSKVGIQLNENETYIQVDCGCINYLPYSMIKDLKEGDSLKINDELTLMANQLGHPIYNNRGKFEDTLNYVMGELK